MVLETAQLLSTAVHVLAPDYAARGFTLYRPTHANHPCAVWTRTSQYNFGWLQKHGIRLAAKYERRYDQTHASLAVIAGIRSVHLPFTSITRTSHPNCTPHKDVHPTTEAYRLTLREKWAADARPPRWTRDQPPEWR